MVAWWSMAKQLTLFDGINVDNKIDDGQENESDSWMSQIARMLEELPVRLTRTENFHFILIIISEL